MPDQILDQWFLYEQRVRFSNLTSLSLTRCWPSESVWNVLSLLVQDQLTSLRLSMDDDVCYAGAASRPSKSQIDARLLH